MQCCKSSPAGQKIRNTWIKETRILSGSHVIIIVTEEDKLIWYYFHAVHQSVSPDSNDASLEAKLGSGHYLGVMVTEDTDSLYMSVNHPFKLLSSISNS